MQSVEVLGIATIPMASGTATLISQPTTPLRSITGYLPMANAARPGSQINNQGKCGTAKYPDLPCDPCAKIAYFTAKGVKLPPEAAKQITNACAKTKGVTPEGTSRYQPESGTVTTSSGDEITAEELSQDTSGGIGQWISDNKFYIGVGAAALVGIWLLKR